MKVIDIQIKSGTVFRVDGIEYRVSFPLPIVAEMETALNRSMKYASDWLCIDTKEVRTVLEFGLRSNQPTAHESVAAKIVANLDPEEIETVIDALCVSAFPKAMARLHEELEKAQERVKKGLSALPNGQGGDAS